MFGNRPPQPLPTRAVAMQIVQQKHQQKRRDFDAHRLVVEPPGGEVALVPPSSAIEFEVDYTLGEYLSILRDHLAFTLRRQSRAARLRQALLPLAVALPALLAAWLVDPGWLRVACLSIGALALACLPITTNLWVALLGPPLFYVKRRRVQRCAFRIDAAGIRRTSRMGTLVRAWADIDGVRRYRQGYLLLMGRGGMPIPYRCLDRKQQATLRRWASFKQRIAPTPL